MASGCSTTEDRWCTQSCAIRGRCTRGARGAGGEAGCKKVTAPMPGKVARLLVSEGDTVEAGAGVVVIEAMKMRHEWKSPTAGNVQGVAVAVGATVKSCDTLEDVEKRRSGL